MAVKLVGGGSILTFWGGKDKYDVDFAAAIMRAIWKERYWHGYLLPALTGPSRVWEVPLKSSRGNNRGRF
jgi:hypothetical protein